MTKLVAKLADFQAAANINDFAEVFGPGLGPHLWAKYVKAGKNLLALYPQLDMANQGRLVRYLEG